MQTPSVFGATTIAEYLNLVLGARQRANPRYSMRSLAKQLELSVAMLSRIAASSTTPSPEMTEKIAQGLKLPAAEEEYLLLLGEIERAKSVSLKTKISARLNKLRPRDRPRELRLDLFVPMARGYVLMLMEIADVEPLDPARIHRVSDLIRVPEERLQAAIAKLLELGLLEKTAKGTVRRVKGEVVVFGALSHPEIRKFHQDFWKRALDAIPNATSEDSVYCSDLIPFRRDRLPELREATYRFLDTIHDLSSDEKNPDAVFGLAVGAFRIFP